MKFFSQKFLLVKQTKSFLQKSEDQVGKKFVLDNAKKVST